MQIKMIGPDISKSWTASLESSQYAAFGIALLWYKPEHRLSISIWSKSFSKNIRLYGPRKLSWEK